MRSTPGVTPKAAADTQIVVALLLASFQTKN